MSWRRALAIARAEWLLNARDPRSLVVIFALPILLLILYGYGLNFDQKHLPVAVQDLDRSDMSREIIQRAASSGYFDFVADVRSNADIPRLLRSRQALMVLVIPPDFSGKLLAGHQAHLQLVLDGSDSVTAGTALGYAQSLAAALSEEAMGTWARLLGASEATLAGVSVHIDVLYNPGLSSAAFIVPGLIGVVMALMAGLLTSTCVVREREVGTIEALLVTPVKPAEVILGKLLPYLGLAMVDVGLLVVVGGLTFGVHPRGSLVELFAVSVVFVVACLSIGLAISGRASTQRTAIVGGIMTLMLPTIILSGFIFPITSMPTVLRGIANALPATQYLVADRTIYLRGLSLWYVWPSLLALTALAVGFFTVAVRGFKTRL
jgi:ABC-2 type transport system permease protein